MKGRYASLLLVPIAIFGSFLLYGCSESSTPRTKAREDFVIEYGDGSYVPAELTVERGQKVTFVNKSAVNMWPASDVHPVHFDYPEFDARREIGPGQSWSFVFDRIGSWQFHDHLRSEIKGEIVVVE